MTKVTAATMILEKTLMKFTAVTTLLAVTDGLSTKGMDGVPSRLQIRFLMLILVILLILRILLILQMINDVKIKMDDMGKLRIGSL